MRVGLLGPLEITGDDGAPVELPGGKPRILLAVLACHANRPVASEVLVESLWGADPPRRADASLRVYIHHLRSALGAARIGRRAGGYVAWLRPDDLDIERFTALVAGGREAMSAGEPERAGDLLGAALSLWRGPALAGLESVPILAADAAGMEELRLQALEQRLEVDLLLGRHERIVAELRALTGRYPLRETFRGHLIRALAGAGRVAEAMTVFDETRRILAEELGIDPSQRLRDLHLSILRDDPALRPAGVDPVVPSPAPPAEREPTGPPAEGAVDAAVDAPAARTDATAPRPLTDAAVIPRQLPAGVAGFAGRVDRLAQLDGLAPVAGHAAVPIATISGAGGIGKTTLAVHWARAAAHRFPDGQLFVDLCGFDSGRPPVDPETALGLFLTALGFPARRLPATLPERENLYRSVLADRRVLVVLDNARDPAQVRPLLPGGAGCLVVVTSRNLLTGLVAAGARAMVLSPLDAAQSRVLLERRLGRERVAAEPDAVDEIIARCGGLPLALSVVAARMSVMTGAPLAALTTELTGGPKGSGPALDGFSSGDAATDLRAVFSWSYRVLQAGTARFFRLLSLHPGPDITVHAAASLAGVPLGAAHAALRHLHAASLLTEANPGRYSYHALVRAYAIELAEVTDPAPERDAALGRLLDHLVHTADAATMIIDPNQSRIPIDPAADGVAPAAIENRSQALAWFDAERAVLVAAVERARHGFESHAWQLARSCVVYLDRGAHWQDWITVLSAGVEAARRTGQRTMEAFMLRSLGRAFGRLHRYDETYAHLRVAADLYRDIGDVAGVAQTVGAFGEALQQSGRYDEALPMFERGYELYRQAGVVLGQARCLGAVGYMQTMLGSYDEAIATCRRALELSARISDRNGMAGMYDSLGVAYQRLDSHCDAVECYRSALDALEGTGERFFVGVVLGHLGDAYRVAGDIASARHNYRRALAIFDRLGAPEAGAVRGQLDALDRDLGRRSRDRASIKDL